MTNGSLRNLLRIEDSDELLGYRSNDGLLLWPLIRAEIHLDALLKIHGTCNPWKSRANPNLLRVANYAIKSLITLRKAMESRKDTSKVAIFTTSSSCVSINKFYVNRLSDPLAEQYPRHTTVFERAHNLEFSVKRAIPNFVTSEGLFFLPNVASRINVSKNEILISENFVYYLKKNYPVNFEEGYWAEVTKSLANKISRVKIELKFFERFLAKIRPRLVLVENGCYGGSLAIFIYCARKAGVRVAEYQHGLVSKNHHAYNYGDSLIHSEYREYLPHDFLSYGQLWSDAITVPCNKINIGNPWLSTIANQNLASASNLHKTDYLIVSSGLNPNILIKFCIELRAAQPNTTIKIRPHPSERAHAKLIYGALTKQNITIDDEENVYLTLAHSGAVIGEISTVLYEAVIFNLPVFCLESAVSRDNNVEGVVTFISSVADLLNGLKSFNPEIIALENRKIWEPNWEINYKNYLSSIMGADFEDS